MNSKKSPTKKAGFTLLETLIAMLIFALTMGGLANLFVATKRHILHARSRVAAGELGRYFLDRLQMQVRQDWWDIANSTPNDPPPNYLLSLGDSPSSRKWRSTNLDVSADGFPQYDDAAGFTSVTQAEEDGFEEPSLPNDRTYYPVYEISNKDGLRKVKLTICWQEP